MISLCEDDDTRMEDLPCCEVDLGREVEIQSVSNALGLDVTAAANVAEACGQHLAKRCGIEVIDQNKVTNHSDKNENNKKACAHNSVQTKQLHGHSVPLTPITISKT